METKVEMIIIPKDEFENVVYKTVLRAFASKNNQSTPKAVPIQVEGGVEFAIEILREKAGIESKPTVYKWSHEGRIPCKKRGKKLWFYRDELEAWIEDGMPHIGQRNAANKLAGSLKKAS